MDDNPAYIPENERYKHLARCKNLHNVTILKELPKRMNITSQPAAGTKGSVTRFVLKASPPNVLIGGPVSNPPGLPPKTCGKDGLRIGALLNSAICGISTPRV